MCLMINSNKVIRFSRIRKKNDRKVNNKKNNKTEKNNKWNLLCYKICWSWEMINRSLNFNSTKWSQNYFKVCLILWESIKWAQERDLEIIFLIKSIFLRKQTWTIFQPISNLTIILLNQVITTIWVVEPMELINKWWKDQKDKKITENNSIIDKIIKSQKMINTKLKNMDTHTKMHKFTGWMNEKEISLLLKVKINTDPLTRGKRKNIKYRSLFENTTMS